MSQITESERTSYTILLENAGFNSTEIYVNLGLILWIPIIIVGLIPLAWLVDTFCTVKDPRTAMFGGRKPLTRKPLV